MIVLLFFACCKQDNSRERKADSLPGADSVNAADVPQHDTLLRTSILFDTSWKDRRLTFWYVQRTRQDSLIIKLDGFSPAKIPVSASWIDSAQTRKILVSGKWLPVPVSFFGDSVCVFSLINSVGEGRAMARVLVVDKSNKSLTVISENNGECLADLAGQVYYIISNESNGELLIHSSVETDSNEVEHRYVVRYHVTKCGLVQIWPAWDIYKHEFDTSLYPYDASPKTYRNYFIAVLASQKK